MYFYVWHENLNQIIYVYIFLAKQNLAFMDAAEPFLQDFVEP